MKPTTDNALAVLKSELAFLDSGGYHQSVGERQPLFCMETGASWRQPLFFEDSPSCPKPRYCACDLQGECVLLSFVPVERRHGVAPCWHIPLDEKAQTIASLYRKAPNKEIEAALRAWLVKTIHSLEERAAPESARGETASRGV